MQRWFGALPVKFVEPLNRSAIATPHKLERLEQTYPPQNLTSRREKRRHHITMKRNYYIKLTHTSSAVWTLNTIKTIFQGDGSCRHGEIIGEREERRKEGKRTQRRIWRLTCKTVARSPKQATRRTCRTKATPRHCRTGCLEAADDDDDDSEMKERNENRCFIGWYRSQLSIDARLLLSLFHISFLTPFFHTAFAPIDFSNLRKNSSGNTGCKSVGAGVARW